MDRVDGRAVVGLGVGVLGVGFGIAAVALHTHALAVAAGIFALVAGVLAFLMVRRLRRATGTIDELIGRVTELEGIADHESRSRADAEEKLASRIQLTAVRRGTEIDALTDNATGLFSEGYFTVALEARISAARRNLKPVGVVLIEVIEDLEAGLPHPADPTYVTESIKTTIRQADTACRLLDGGYALVLEDTTENGAIWTVERIRRKMAAVAPGLTMWAGIACYPAHGLSTDEILDQADNALDMAREWRQDRIEIATTQM